MVKRIKQFSLIALAGVLLVVALVAIKLSTFGSSILNVSEEQISYVVEPGKGLIRVINQLKERGIIDDARSFLWFARLSGRANNIRTGEYIIERGMTVDELLDNMVEGKVKQYSLTLVEGLNFKQTMELIASDSTLMKTLPDLSAETVMTALGRPGEHPEGRFLPDTYHFPLGTTDIAFLKRAFNAMEEVLSRLWEDREQNLPYDSAYEALTMASIVEKETAVPEERNQIAGVFVRRLQKRMRLQTDPTVIYGMGDKYKGNIRKRDLRRDTPYNTYTRRGLPPTPIAMPGEKAILAALHPEPGDALYFVAKGDGSHHFSATNEEHVMAVRKYQIKKRRKDYRSTPQNGQNPSKDISS